jgi:hypothetical protein
MKFQALGFEDVFKRNIVASPVDILMHQKNKVVIDKPTLFTGSKNSNW